MKNKIRACYPELSGVQMNLVKFDNRFTEMLENQEKYGQERPALRRHRSIRKKPGKETALSLPPQRRTSCRRKALRTDWKRR